MKYPSHVLNLMSFKGFKERYLEYIPQANTYEQAYEMTECVYIGHFGKRKYKNYNSFRVMISRKEKIK